MGRKLKRKQYLKHKKHGDIRLVIFKNNIQFSLHSVERARERIWNLENKSDEYIKTEIRNIITSGRISNTFDDDGLEILMVKKGSIRVILLTKDNSFIVKTIYDKKERE